MDITALPSWLIAIILTALFVASLEAGWRLHDFLTREPKDEVGAGYIAAAAVGLLSLLLGFTLALSLDRYELRRTLVVDEANAISTVWESDRLFDQPYRGRLDELLRAYVKERLALPSAGLNASALDAADRRAEALQQSIWQETAADLRAPGQGALTEPVVIGTNDMFNFTAAEHAALTAVVPPPVIWTLVAVAIVSALTTGYGLAAAGHRHRLASIGLFVAVALTMTLIFELDEPRTGLIVVPQAPMEHIANSILAAPPAN